MAASEAAVTAVMEALGCWAPGTARGWCRIHDEFSSPVSERGCEYAVKIADAAVDADQANIQAATLREFAEEWPDEADSLSRVSSRYVRNSLLRRADRIEGKP